MSYPAISLATATVGRHRCPQKRLQTARQPPVHPNSSPDHRACNSLTPFRLQGSFTETPFFRSLLELQGEGHLEEALNEYDEAIRLDLQTAPGYNNRGSAYNGWGSSSGPLRIMVHEIGFPCFEARIPVF